MTTLRDRRRAKAREELYRAIERRDRLLDRLAYNTAQIKKLKRTLKRLEVVSTHTLMVSVAEGKVLQPVEVEVAEMFSDEIPDWNHKETT